MSQAGFLQNLQEFPKDTINEEMVELMEPYIKAEDYTIEIARRVCDSQAHFTPGGILCTISDNVPPDRTFP